MGPSNYALGSDVTFYEHMPTDMRGVVDDIVEAIEPEWAPRSCCNNGLALSPPSWNTFLLILR